MQTGFILKTETQRFKQSNAESLVDAKTLFRKVSTLMFQVSIHTANTQGQSDPYISLRIVPSSKFPDTPKHRTRTQRRTLFPLFDETFDL